MRRRPALVLFVLALALRLAYLAEIRDVPWFDVPIVDGANYFRTAETIARGDLLGGREAFWQPPLYPYFLALLLTLVGARMFWILAAQAALGSLSCVIAYCIGRRLYGDRAGTAAGLVLAFYAPLIHFDAQPLIPALHIVLALAGLLFMLRAHETGAHETSHEAGGGETGRRAGLSAGLAWGLSATATPNILLAVPAAVAWIWRERRRAILPVFLLGVVLPVGCVAARNLFVAREPVLISTNGGINFYIGNNADYDRTVRIRPGGEFARLAQEPENLGITGEAAKSRWFAGRAVEFLTRYPGPAIRLYLRKARDLVAGREIPRNENMYDYRRTSWLLSAFLWRWIVSFPFGVLAPLALAGWALGASLERSADPSGARTRSGTNLLLLYAGSYALSVLIFFPTDRYRLPIVPVLAVFAGRLLAAPRVAWRRKSVLAALVGGLVLFNLDAFQASESWPEEEALNRAYALRVKGDRAGAKAAYQEAIDLHPGRIDPYNALAVMAAEDGDWESAVWRYRELLGVAPDFVEVRCSLGDALMALGRKEEARREWQTAIYLAPKAGLALARLGLAYLDEGALDAAFEYGERAVAARPDLPEPHLALGLAARALRRRAVALHELEEAARLFPKDAPGARRTREVLEQMHRRGQGAGQEGKPDG